VKGKKISQTAPAIEQYFTWQIISHKGKKYTKQKEKNYTPTLQQQEQPHSHYLRENSN
jgi:hypothetical protein